MALFPLMIRILDDYNRTTNKRWVVSAADFAAASAIAIDLAQDLDAVIEGQITEVRLAFDLVGNLVGVKTTPDAGANIDEGVSLSAWLDKSPPRRYTLKFPTPANVLVQSDGTLDMSNADLVALMNDFTGAIAVQVSDGDVIDSFIGGVLDTD